LADKLTVLAIVSVLMQAGVDAGPARASCAGSVVTLAAEPINPPANYEIQWEDAAAPGVFLVDTPMESTQYRVFLTDLDTLDVYEDTTWILVHPGSADLFSDGLQNDQDWAVLFAAWGEPPPHPDFDPNQNQRLDILDWFYICNYDVAPPNTPPMFSVEDAFTSADEAVNVAYTLDDLEQVPTLVIETLPANGLATFISGDLRYTPNEGFLGLDSFWVAADDGYLRTPAQEVLVEVLAPDTWSDLYNDIFLPRCNACHIEAVSGGLSLATYGAAQVGGNSGAGFVAGQPDLSPIYLRVRDGSMPLIGPPLPMLEVERIRLWIVRGAAP
jgi:hypothetical protein